MSRVRYRLRDEVWDKGRRYYESAARSSGNGLDKAGLQRVTRHLPDTGLVLDCGCGEGSHGEVLTGRKVFWVGVDFAQQGLRMARERGSRMVAVQGDLSRLPFRSRSFDAVFSAYTFEHLLEPDLALYECIRVTKANGTLAVIAPNYGSPLFPSPCSREEYRKRFLRRVRAVLTLGPGGSLNWERVEPRALEEAWKSDYDTVVEPYLPTLRHVLNLLGCRVLESGTAFVWAAEHKPCSLGGLTRLLVKAACATRVPLLRDWGPNMYLIARRVRP